MSSRNHRALSNARINITLDVIKNKQNLKKELPLKLLVLGDFSAGQNTTPIAERSRESVNQYNFNEVMKAVSPRLALTVPDKINGSTQSINVDLVFESLKDYTPHEVVKQVPQLNKVLAMRLLLKELKRQILDNPSFRKTLERLLKNKEACRTLLSDMQVCVSKQGECNGE